MNTIKTEDKIEIKQGYKKTSVGIIPEDWKVKRLGDLGKTFNGLTGKTKDDFGIGLPFVSYLNVFRNNKIEENTSFDYVNIESSENQNTLNYGDLIFTTSSETPNEVGISSVVLFKPKEKLYLNSFCFGMRLNDFSILKPEYAVYLLRGQNFRREMYKLAQGSTRYNLSKASFVKIQITVPSLEEQTAIADCLSTWDKGIEKLSALIASKKEQKKGLMQGLFSGKLKVENGELIQAKDGEDFTKEWKEVKLGEVFALKKGKNLSKSVVVDKGKHKCVLYGELYTKYSEVIKKVYSSTNEENSFLSKVNDVLIPSSTTTNGWDLITSSCIQEDNVMLGGDIIVLRPKNNRINSVFFSYLFSNAMHKEVIGYTQGVTIIHLYGSDLVKIKLNLPSIEEQTAIAEILQTADKEIELLEKQLTQLELQKKGLMQVLLTGEKRLV